MTAITVEMPDGSKWKVPIDVIAKHRADHYAHEFGGSWAESFELDTLPAFKADPDCAIQWASLHMEWSKDIKPFAYMIRPPSNVFDFERGWTEGKKEVVD